MIISLSLSALIIMQQMAIFIGLMMRTYGTITDTNQADIWVMNEHVQMIDDIKPLKQTALYHVRSVEGVEWAVPFYKGLIRARLLNGQFQTCNLIGVDDTTLIGAPPMMASGSIYRLRDPDAVIVDDVGAQDKLAYKDVNKNVIKYLEIGDTLELNDARAHVIGLCTITPTFQSQPVIYTTYNRALKYAPYERKQLSFILVKAAPGVSLKELCERIYERTGFASYTQKEFEWVTVSYYLKNTGIPINFGIAVFLGLLVGAAIAGQIFFNFTSDILKYLAIFSVMGASQLMLVAMVLIQALWLSFLGWGIGSGAAALIGFLARGTDLAFYMPWQLFLGTGLIILLVCIAASLVSVVRIYNLDLGTIFKQ